MIKFKKEKSDVLDEEQVPKRQKKIKSGKNLKSTFSGFATLVKNLFKKNHRPSEDLLSNEEASSENSSIENPSIENPSIEKTSGDKKPFDFGFRNWNIRNKILTGFIVIILALIYITISSYSLISKVANSYLPIIQEQSAITLAVQKMNLAQRDFMMVDRTNEDFFKEASKLAEGEVCQTERTANFTENYQTASDKLKALAKENFIENDKELLKSVQNLQAEVDNYKTNFENIHMNVQKRGFDMYGIVGQIDKMRKQLKTKLSTLPEDKNLTQAIANLDIAHVNYLYTQEKRFMDKIKDQLGYPNTQVALGDYSDSFKADYKEISEGYVAIFGELVALDDTIGRNETEGYFGALAESSKKVDEITNQMVDALNKKLKSSIAGVIGVLIVTVLIIIGLAVGFAILLANIISKPIKNVNVMLEDISEGEGDLTKTLNITTKEEMGTMATLFNKFVSKIKDVVVQVKNSSSTLTNYTDEIHDAIEQANESIEQISIEVQRMIDGIQNSASAVEETTASIQELSSSAQMISKEASMAANDSEQVLSASKQGVDKLVSVVQSVEQVKVSSESMATVIDTLKLSSEEIVTIVNIINSIAEQTSLLALNASIEAARAGEHGRGFSVVADEVRKLAEQSKGSAFKINDIIKQISNHILGASATMSKEKALVEKTVKEAYDTNVSFTKILELIEGINKKITNISHGSEQQSLISEEMAKAVDGLSDIMQENVQSSERIGMNIENQVATFEEIGASITELKNMASILESETNRFKVEE